MKRLVFLVMFALAAASMPYTQSKTTTVYVTANGKKFHAKGCRTIKKSEVKALPKEEALKKGLEPCKVCKP